MGLLERARCVVKSLIKSKITVFGTFLRTKEAIPDEFLIVFIIF